MDLVFHRRDPAVPFRIRNPDRPVKGALKEAATQGLSRLPEEDGGGLFCAACSHPITSFSNMIEMNGRHDHRLVNPGGLVFRVGCFSRAAGCATEGVPTVETSWFPEYAWSYALCGSCHTHLGWHYSGALVPGGFWGLILTRLVRGRPGRS